MATEQKTAPSNEDTHLAALNPTVIVRGESFVVTGRLVDNSTGQGIGGQTIKIFWEHFTWTEYETDRTNLENNYLIGQGTTNSNGDFSISCADSDHSKSAGLQTVYAVFPGNPLLGPIEENRQYTTDLIECYAYAVMVMQTNQTIVRRNSGFTADAALFFDNSTISNPQPVLAAEGTDITFSWLGNLTNVSISSSVAHTTLIVPGSTTIGTHPLTASYNISTLSLPYVTGTITSASQLSSSAADWCNNTINIDVFSGAGIVFSIDAPLPPAPLMFPSVVRGVTSITLSGQITDTNGNPFGYPINLEVWADSTTTIHSMATDNDGNFTETFILNNSLVVGDHSLSVDVVPGQGITASVEYHNITIYGNSTIATPRVNGSLVTSTTALAMPGENITISGTIRDTYSNIAIPSMAITAQWEDFGVPVSTTTSGSGTYTLTLQVPQTVNPALKNGTVYLSTGTTQYYTTSNYSFLVNVFSSVQIRVWLNQTEILDGSSVSTLAGNVIYNYSRFTFHTSVKDNFGRGVGNRDIIIQIGSLTYNETLNSAGNLTLPAVGYLTLPVNNYSISVTFKDEPTYSLSFQLEVNAPTAEPPTSPPPTTGNTNGGLNLSDKFAIGILVSTVSLIVIVSVIYAFGRFRKAKKNLSVAELGAGIDLPGVMKMLEEAAKAKDYRRAIVLCYRIYELLCMQDLHIVDASRFSPRELARIVSSTNRIPVRDITMMVMRYEEARFSDHKISKNAYNLTRQALENIQLALKKEAKGKKA